MSEGLLREDSVPSGSKLKAECQTLTPDELSKKMFEIVDDVNAVFQVSWFNNSNGTIDHTPLVTDPPCEDIINRL